MLLIKRLLHGQPTFFQTHGGLVYYISAEVLQVVESNADARIINKLQDPSDVIALVDADDLFGVHSPCDILLSSQNIRVVVTSSP